MTAHYTDVNNISNQLTHWGRVTHICVNKVTIIVSDNGLSPGRRQAIIWNNAGILLIGTLGTNASEILIEILTFSIKKGRLKVSSAKRQPFCLGLNVLMASQRSQRHDALKAYQNVRSLNPDIQFKYWPVYDAEPVRSCDYKYHLPRIDRL